MCGKQHQTLHRESDGPPSRPLKIWISPTTLYGLTYTSTDSRENHPSQHVRTTIIDEDQPEEDSGRDDTLCPKTLAGQSERREYSKNRRINLYLVSTVRPDRGVGSEQHQELSQPG